MERNEDFSRRNRHSSDKKGKNILIKIIICIIIIIFVVAISSIVWYNTALSSTGTSDEKVTIEIELGTGASKIAEILEENDLIKSSLAFKIYVKLNNITNFQAGTYTITKDMNVSDIVEYLQSGVAYKDGINITFIEGKTFTWVAETIAENTNNTEEDVYNLVKDESYIDSLIDEYWFITDEIKDEDIYYALEGYLFPDTYTFESEDVTVEEIFEVLLSQMEDILDNYREDIENSNYTVHEYLSIASIIECEAIYDDDRKDISSVIYNRLSNGMNIGSDVTTYYAFQIEKGTRDLYSSEINTYNAYNTRGPNMEGKLPARTYFYGK